MEIKQTNKLFANMKNHSFIKLDNFCFLLVFFSLFIFISKIKKSAYITFKILLKLDLNFWFTSAETDMAQKMRWCFATGFDEGAGKREKKKERENGVRKKNYNRKHLFICTLFLFYA